jgi:hypothetical protein
MVASMQLSKTAQHSASKTHACWSAGDNRSALRTSQYVPRKGEDKRRKSGKGNTSKDKALTQSKSAMPRQVSELRKLILLLLNQV